ncbi:MAG TPA: response regulator transcription factor [Usitatibacter sp.]|jgi:DNA-binding NarL/FixJ family response regulator|nr:response regulator transcription factor [Usitatibacter sp.]
MRLLIADEHELVAHALGRLLRDEPDMQVVGHARTGRQVMELMLSAETGTAHVVRALRAGASGYLPKSASVAELRRAIREVHAGRRHIHPSLADSVLKALVAPGYDDPLSLLSTRERQVLQLLAEGHAYDEIARILSLSRKTVETYRARMLGKLDVKDFASLVRFAIRHGIIPLE